MTEKRPQIAQEPSNPRPGVMTPDPTRTAVSGALLRQDGPSARQRYALANPSGDPKGVLADRSLWSDDVTRDGNVLRTALAVDR